MVEGLESGCWLGRFHRFVDWTDGSVVADQTREGTVPTIWCRTAAPVKSAPSISERVFLHFGTVTDATKLPSGAGALHISLL